MAQHEEMTEIERRLRGLDAETPVLVLGDGSQVLWGVGGGRRDGEVPPDWVGLAEPGDGSVLLHNHPDSGAPTDTDFETADALGVTEIRVVVEDGTWTVRGDQRGWPELANVARICKQAATTEIGRNLPPPGLSREEFRAHCNGVERGIVLAAMSEARFVPG